MSQLEVPKNLQTATLGGGCFWCIESLFLNLNGITNIRSGYCGGKPEEATYKLVKSGLTEHAEVIHFNFNPDIIDYKDILTIFMNLHDPTTLNRQGVDVGPQYRSVIFYHNEYQKVIANEVIQMVKDEKVYKNPIVTEVSPYNGFYQAEEYHQDYYTNNPEDEFCQTTIDPKVRKLYKKYYNKTIVAAASN